MKTALLTLLWAAGAAAHAADPEQFWFKNDTACADARITVRSYCEVAHREYATKQRNTGCTEQELVIQQPGKPALKRDLLEHEPVGDDFHITSSLRCVAAGKQHYLLITLDTGGNCDTCELQAIVGLDGKWKRYGNKWQAAPAAERRALQQNEANWRPTDSVDLPNNVREEPSAPW